MTQAEFDPSFDARVEAARRATDVYNRGDLETLKDFYAEDVVWHTAGDHALAGDYQGRDELIEYFATVRRMTSETIRLQPVSILASDDEISMFTRVTAERPGRSLDVFLTQTFKVRPDGRCTEYWAIADDQEAIDEFWS